MIEAEGLHYTYPGGIAALAGIDLAVAAGERLAVLGANGAGKSTLLLHLNGTLRPQRGRVCLDGRPATYDRRALTAWRSAVGLVLQDPDDQLFAGTVAEDISFGPLNLGLGGEAVRARVAAALAAMAIEDLANRPIPMLSLGQKRRAAIAGILAMQPRCVLLDEPTAGLDADGTRQLLAALERLVAAGTTIVYATHDVELACAWSDRIAIFGRGSIAAVGEATRLLADRALLASAGLRMPMVLEVAAALGRRGLLDPTALPRSVPELLAALPE
jgi:cobalt/nickel transport system ATP-binding protein